MLREVQIAVQLIRARLNVFQSENLFYVQHEPALQYNLGSAPVTDIKMHSDEPKLSGNSWIYTSKTEILNLIEKEYPNGCWN